MRLLHARNVELLDEVAQAAQADDHADAADQFALPANRHIKIQQRLAKLGDPDQIVSVRAIDGGDVVEVRMLVVVRHIFRAIDDDYLVRSKPATSGIGRQVRLQILYAHDLRHGIEPAPHEVGELFRVVRIDPPAGDLVGERQSETPGRVDLTADMPLDNIEPLVGYLSKQVDRVLRGAGEAQDQHAGDRDQHQTAESDQQHRRNRQAEPLRQVAERSSHVVSWLGFCRRARWRVNRIALRHPPAPCRPAAPKPLVLICCARAIVQPMPCSAATAAWPRRRPSFRAGSSPRPASRHWRCPCRSRPAPDTRR